MIVGTNEQAVLQQILVLKSNNIALATMKGMDGTQRLLEQIEAISPVTVTVFRTKAAGDFPAVLTSPEEAARQFYQIIKPVWSGVKVDLYEPVNEWHGIQPEYKVRVIMELLRLGNADGFCLLVPGDAPGNPTTFDEVRGYAPIYRYILERPCNMVSAHSYGIDKLLSESGLWLGYRHRLNLIAIKEVVPLAEHVNVILSEVGPYDGRRQLDCTTFVNDMMSYSSGLQSDPYVIGFHAFTLGLRGEWSNWTDCISSVTQALLNNNKY